MTDQRIASPSDYLAAERTFLAWIRACVALMGFGFLVARFGLFMQMLQAGPSGPAAPSYGLSFWFGTGFIILGIIVTAGSLRSYRCLVQQLKRGGPGFHRPTLLAVGVAITLVAAGVTMATYLTSVRRTKARV